MPGQAPFYQQAAQETSDEEQGLKSAAETNGRSQGQHEHFRRSSRSPVRQNLVLVCVGVLTACALLFNLVKSVMPASSSTSFSPTQSVEPLGGRPSIRQLLEGDALKRVMTDNLMSLGHFSEAQRSEVEERVSQSTRQLSDKIHSQSPAALDEKLEKLTVSEEVENRVMRVMRGLSDSRVKSLADDMSRAIHEVQLPNYTTVDRDSFKAAVGQTLQSRLDEVRELRDELFPDAKGGGPAETSGRFQALLHGLENSSLMQSFDRWKERAESARKAKEPTPETIADVRRLQRSSPEDISDDAMTDQFREFFYEVHDSFANEFYNLKEEWRRTLSPEAIKRDLKNQYDGMKQDVHDSVKVMKDDIHDTLSPEAMKWRVRDKIDDMRTDVHRSIAQMEQDARETFSPQYVKQRLATHMQSVLYGNTAFPDDLDGSNSTEAPVEELSVIDCLTGLFTDPEEVLTCSMHAMSLYVDMVRDVFEEEP